MPVDCEASYLLFQAGDSRVMSDSYFDFCREFKLRDGEDIVWYEQLHFEFSARPPHRLGFPGMHRWSYEFEDPTDFFAVIGLSPEFQAGLSFPHWSFQVYHCGV